MEILAKLLIYLSQATLRDFTSKEATLEEFFAFLDRVEHDVYPVSQEITGTTNSHGRRPHGEAYYLGTYTAILLPLVDLDWRLTLYQTGAPSNPPPTIKSRYGREYIPLYQYYGRGNSELEASVPLPGLNELEASILTEGVKKSEDGRRRLEEAGLDVESAVAEEETVDQREGADSIGSAMAEERSVPAPQRKGADTPMLGYAEWCWRAERAVLAAWMFECGL
jgi:hypothetical protein